MKKIVLMMMAASAVMFVTTGVRAGEEASLKPDRVQISYVLPANPEHRPIYDELKERRVLERFREYLGHLRLPGTLLLKTEGCDGESNAWYEEKDHSVTVCYEYLEEVLEYAPKQTTATGVTRTDAIVGPTIEVFMHEVSHALFDMLHIPILGREEDAADQLAAYSMLQLGKEDARRTVVGVAFMYGHEAQEEQSPEMKHFADVHGLPAQRFYNLLCMAYGAEPELFADVVAKGYLPKSRAEGCAGEYRQVAYAVQKLIHPYSDEALRKKTKAKKLLRPAPAK
jgi:hypothetical protein